MKKQRTALGLVLWILFALSRVFSDEAALNNDDIVRLSNAGLETDVIITKIKASATMFDISVERLLALKEADVEYSVIAAAVDKGDTPAKAVAAPADSEQGSIITYPAPGTSFRDRLQSGDEGMEMVVIPAGRFRMGCVSGKYCTNDEKPVHEVVIPRPFAMSKYEVTFEDYDKFTYPNKVRDEGWGRDRRPIINVSWDDANKYAVWLSDQTGKRYRLPTEAEWEYAARAGSSSMYHFGNSESQLCRYGNHADTSVDYMPWHNKYCSDGVGDSTAVVGRYQPNAFGLYDMHGNVFEWVQDCWNDSYAGAPTDGSAWNSGQCDRRVIRGGSWVNTLWGLRSANRGGIDHSDRILNRGFRLVRDF